MGIRGKMGGATMRYGIDSLQLTNFGQIGSADFDHFSGINLIIGENGTGKTCLLKALYAAVRSMEEYERGDDVRSLGEILAEKLRWTFQVDKLGDLVTKGSTGSLQFEMKMREQSLQYQCGQDCTRKLTSVQPILPKGGNSVYIPAKEVLSLFSVILRSRDIDRSFGFDDTYYDLVRALQIPPTRGKNYSAFSESRKIVTDVIDGKVDYDIDTGKWFYKNRKNQKFSIGATSEGVKKIAIMDRLLANGYLDRNSIIFIDEIESALHPDAICKFLDMIDSIAGGMGIQFFITSHSYFVIKKLYLIALQNKNKVSCISLGKDRLPVISDMSQGMPENSIIDTSIRLYEQEIDEVL